MSTNVTRNGTQLASTQGELLPKPKEPKTPSAALTLTAGLLGFALVCLDASIVNVALPAMGSSLGGGMSGLQWVVDAYTLAFAALMLSTGAFSDRAGATRAYALGAGVFTLASAACGLATSQEMLIAARAVQGVGGAVVSAVALSLTMTLFTEPAERAKAMGVFGFVASAGVIWMFAST